MNLTRFLLGLPLVAMLTLAALAPAARAQTNVLAPGNPIVGVAATPGSPTSSLAVVGGEPGNAYPSEETPARAIDNNTLTKYLNFQRTNAGLIVTPTAASVVNGFQFTTANDHPERDPRTITIEGTNSPNATTTLNSTWTQIYSGTAGLDTDPNRFTAGQQVVFNNLDSYASYRVLITDVRDVNAANSFQFSEIQLLTVPVPEPASVGIAVLAAGAAALAARRRKPAPEAAA